jgi:hypothetical protein
LQLVSLTAKETVAREIVFPKLADGFIQRRVRRSRPSFHEHPSLLGYDVGAVPPYASICHDWLILEQRAEGKKAVRALREFPHLKIEMWGTRLPIENWHAVAFA